MRCGVAIGSVAERAMLPDGLDVSLLLVGVEGLSRVRRTLGGDRLAVDPADSTKLLFRPPVRSRASEEKDPPLARVVIEVKADPAVNMEL